jgi:hypothetical protein
MKMQGIYNTGLHKSPPKHYYTPFGLQTSCYLYNLKVTSSPQEVSQRYKNKLIMAGPVSDEDLIGPPLYELYLELGLEKMHSRARDVGSFVNDAIKVPGEQGTLKQEDLEQVVASIAGDALSLYGMFYLFHKETQQSKVDMSDPRLMFLGPENWLHNDDDPWKLEVTIKAIAGALDNIELSGEIHPGLEYRVIQDALSTIRFVRHSISTTLRDSAKGTTAKQTKNVQTARESNTRKTPQDAKPGSGSSSLKRPEQVSTPTHESKADQAAQDVLIQQLQDKLARQTELLQGHAALQAELSEARAANTKLRMDAINSGASMSTASNSLLGGDVGAAASASLIPMAQQSFRMQSFGSVNAVSGYLEQEVQARNAEIARLQQALMKSEVAKARWKDMVTHLVESGSIG